MYQALVRLPSSDNAHVPPRPGFDWSALFRALLRFLHATPRP